MLGGILFCGPALAQDASTNASPKPPAVTSGDAASKTSAAPVAGRNSFTEEQAAHRLADHGYTGAANLNKDDQGIWHGTATKGGKHVNVSVDYQGNIAEQ
jgi:hypothetical protein